MVGRFKNKITYYDYIIGFDLALHKTGISIYNIQKKKFIQYDMIISKGSGEEIFFDLYEKIKEYIWDFWKRNGGAILIVKEALPAQCGKFTTVKTLQQLAKAHASLTIAIMELQKDLHNNICFYDDDGIHSVSVKALFATEECKKPTKTDIRNKIVEMYKVDNSKLTDDISDSMGVIHTLINRKWNLDIKEEIKKIKKEIKSLKKESTIKEREAEMQFLSSIMIKEGKDG